MCLYLWLSNLSKNEFYNYDEGERLVRDATANDAEPPSLQLLGRISYLCGSNRYFPTIFRMLFRRIRDYGYVRHVEKVLFCLI